MVSYRAGFKAIVRINLKEELILAEHPAYAKIGGWVKGMA